MWYVIQVYTGRELEIAQQCRDRVMEDGEDVFVPLAERWTKIRGERTMIMSRLFPGYVFIETDRIEDFYIRLRRIYAMTKVLRIGEEMTPIQKEEEDYLRRLGGDDHVVKYSEGYIEGDNLVVTSGPLKDFMGKVKKVLRHKRLVVMEVPLLGHTVEVTLGMGILERK
ncbi:MAG: antiterminator LoaP [Ruminococcus sp.]|jgi:transcriptional antiterminator NusG|nr:antiterminator LoaP [Ruminococcus sp.]